MKTKTIHPTYGTGNTFSVKFLTDLEDFIAAQLVNWRDHTVQEISDMTNCMKSLRAARNEIASQGYATCVKVDRLILVTIEILYAAGVTFPQARAQ